MERITHAQRHEYWKRVVTECNQSGMKKKEWMKIHNISPKGFYRWQKIFADEDAISLLSSDHEPCQGSFVELTPSLFPEKVSSRFISSAVIRKGDISVEITDSVTDEFLARIFKVMTNA